MITKGVSIFHVPAEAHTRVNGRTASDTDWGWNPGGAGSTGASGRRGSKADTGCDSRPRPTPNTRAPGPMGCKTVMVRRRTLMAVSFKFYSTILPLTGRYTNKCFLK